jgi:hypothetical protein
MEKLCSTSSNSADVCIGGDSRIMFRVVQALRKLIDPVGPLGGILSPSEVYKERLGLPIAAPHTQRVAHTHAPDAAEYAARAVPARIEPADAVPPKGLLRQVSQYMEERWDPIYAPPASFKIEDMIRAANTRVGWRVTQQVRAQYCSCDKAKFTLVDGKLTHERCGREAIPKAATDEEVVEAVQSLAITAADDSYNVFMPTVPGNDAIMTPYGLAKGGTQIRNGRREYREKTAGYAHWDSGTMKERERAQHQAKVAMQQKLEQHVETVIKAAPGKFVPKDKSIARLRAEGVKP